MTINSTTTADVCAVLRRHDLAGIGDDAPADEYMPEASDVAGRLPSMGSVEDTAEMVCAVFTHWFGAEIAGDVARYADVASELWEQQGSSSR